MRRLAPCGLGGDRGAELVAAWRAPDFAPNRKDFKHQGRPEHLLWVRCSGPVPARVCSRCQDLLTDPLTDPFLIRQLVALLACHHLFSLFPGAKPLLEAAEEWLPKSVESVTSYQAVISLANESIFSRTSFSASLPSSRCTGGFSVAKSFSSTSAALIGSPAW
jgi:hypothetical protein